MIIMKFGGSSVGSAETINNVAEIIKSNIRKNPVVVVSAVGGVTDKLIELAHKSVEGGELLFVNIKKIHYVILEQLNLDKSLLDKDFESLFNLVNEIKTSKRIDNKILDRVQSFGEQMSSKIVAAQLNKLGVKAQAFNSWDLGFVTNNEFGRAEPLEETFGNLNNNIGKLDVIPIITGFVGKTEDGDISTLGRGGSDYSAAIIGSAINASEIQIWTDVDGIMSADPKIIENVKSIDKISFAEASELSFFGAKVLHPKTILPAMDKEIPVRVLNTFKPDSNGTIILNKSNRTDEVVKVISCKKDVIMINVNSTRMLGAYGFLARLFNVFEKYKKSVDVISTSEVSVSMTIDNEDNIDQIKDELQDVAEVRFSNNKAIISIVGEGIGSTPGITGKTFNVLGTNNINIEMISSGTSKINITFVVDGNDAAKVIKILHKEYFENGKA
jgi:aspartate kinase